MTVIFKNRQAEYFKVLFWAAESLDQSDFKTTPDLPVAIKMGPPEQPRNRAIPDVQFDQHRSLLSVCSLCLVRKLVMPPAVEAKGKQLHHTGIFLSPVQGRAGHAVVIKLQSVRFCFVVQCGAIWSDARAQPLNLVCPSASCLWPQSAGQSLRLCGFQAIQILAGLLWGSPPDSFKHNPHRQ